MLLTNGPHCRLEKIPFFFEPLETPENNVYPATLPFEFFLDENLGIFRQKGGNELSALLRRVYEDGSMLAGAMNDATGKAQADAAEHFVQSVVTEFTDLGVLEIGCGNGYLLQRFFAAGAVCTGLEPGPQVQARKISGITIVQDFFPSTKLSASYDLVLHFNVLEHIESPLEFLSQQKKLLTPDGRIIFGVPNCEPYLPSGDIPMFVHEHYSYFTRRGLHRLAEQVGLSLETTEVGASGGMLFASMTRQSAVERLPNGPALVVEDFSSRARRLLDSIMRLVEKFPKNALAVYCPSRAMNALCLLGATEVRLVDDNPSMQGGYIPGFENAIETFDSLEDSPPGAVLIFSRTFGNKIKARCGQSETLTGIPVYTIEDIDSLSAEGNPK